MDRVWTYEAGRDAIVVLPADLAETAWVIDGVLYTSADELDVDEAGVLTWDRSGGPVARFDPERLRFDPLVPDPEPAMATSDLHVALCRPAGEPPVDYGSSNGRASAPPLDRVVAEGGRYDIAVPAPFQESRRPPAAGPVRRSPRPTCENHSVHVGQPLIRGLRALVFAVACVAVTAALHFIAGGSPIGSGAFAAAVAVLTPPAYGIGGRQRGAGALTAACALAQSGLHAWFILASGHAHLVPGPAMTLAHALAMGATAVWLARGDAALAAFLELLVIAFGPGLWPRLLETAGPVLPPRRIAPAPEGVRPQLLLLATAVPRRGPPTAVCFQ
jgi:hypothetical protein